MRFICCSVAICVLHIVAALYDEVIPVHKRELIGGPAGGPFPFDSCSGGATCASGTATTAGGTTFEWHETDYPVTCDVPLNKEECQAIADLDLLENGAALADLSNSVNKVKYPTGCLLRISSSAIYNDQDPPTVNCANEKLSDGTRPHEYAWSVFSCVCKGATPPPPTESPSRAPTAPTTGAPVEWDTSPDCLAVQNPYLTNKCFGFFKTDVGPGTDGVWGVAIAGQSNNYHLSGAANYPGSEYGGVGDYPCGLWETNCEAKFAACHDLCEHFRAREDYLQYNNPNWPHGMCFLYQGWNCYFTPTPGNDNAFDFANTEVGAGYDNNNYLIQDPTWRTIGHHDGRVPTAYPTRAAGAPTLSSESDNACDHFMDIERDPDDYHGLKWKVSAGWTRNSDYPAQAVLFKPYGPDTYYESAFVPVLPIAGPDAPDSRPSNTGWICPAGHCAQDKRWIAFDFTETKSLGNLAMRNGYGWKATSAYSTASFEYYTLDSLPAVGSSWDPSKNGAALIGSYSFDLNPSWANDGSEQTWQIFAVPQGQTVSRYVLIYVKTMPGTSAGIYRIRWFQDCSGVTQQPTPAPTGPTASPTTGAPTKSPTLRPTFAPTLYPSKSPTNSPTPHVDHHFNWAPGESHADINLPLGSTLYFDYNGGHNVHRVGTQAAYDSCDCTTSNELAGDDDGPHFYTPPERNHYYFVCCKPGHCAGGMKAKVSIGMTDSPTGSPTRVPTTFPTRKPTMPHTEDPTTSPTTSPTLAPTNPTASPSASPSRSPTANPSHSPTTSPTETPTKSPTSFPTKSPTTAAPTTAYPTRSPTSYPTDAPTASPTMPTVVKADVKVTEEMSAEDQAASGATASEYDTECDPDTTDCNAACGHSTVTCSTNSRRLDAHGRYLSGGTVSVVFDMTGGGAVYDTFKSSYNLQFSGAVYTLEVEASELSTALTTMSNALTTPPEIQTVEIEDNGLTGESVDEGLSFVAEALASDDIVTTSVVVKQESNPEAAITYCDHATPSDPCLCNPATQVRFDGACRVCVELNQYIADRCNTDDPMPNTALFPNTCAPGTCTAAPTMSPTYGAMCCQCMIERTSSPTQSPTTAEPTTSAPSKSPTAVPSTAPSHSPTSSPSAAPTSAPTSSPTKTPTAYPTEVLDTEDPTTQPTVHPTGSPSVAPTHAPSQSPSPAPTGCAEDVKFCSDGTGQRFRVLEKNCEFARCATYEDEDADADAFEAVALVLGVESQTIQFKDLFLDRTSFKNAARDKKKKLKRNVLHRPRIRGQPLRIKKTDALVRSFDNGGVVTTSRYKGSAMDFKAVDKPEYEGDEIVLTTADNYYFEGEASFKINDRIFDVTTTTLTESTGYHSTTYSERGTSKTCTIDGAAGETMCSIDANFRFVIYVVGSVGGGSEEGTEAPTSAPTTGAPTTGAPTATPTTASPTISIGGQINQMLALGDEIQLKTSGTCEDHSRCESLFYGEGYALCDGMAGQNVPTRYAALDFTGKEFKIISGTSKTRGCTLEGEYLVYNTNGNQDCSNDSQCICICNFFTGSPTTSPTKSEIANLDCAEPPQGFQGNEGGGVIDFAITAYDESTAQFTVDPYMNWDSAFLFFNNEGYPGYTTVSAWTTFTTVREYPFHHLDDHPECRTRLKDSLMFNEIVVDPTNCANFTTHANGSTSYNFYLGTTTCYTNLTLSDCSTSKFQHHAYKYADSFAFVENIYTTDHISQCRRTWQMVDLTVDLGGAVNVLPTASLAALMAVEQNDGGLIVPTQTEQHQVYGDIGTYTIQSDDWAQTVVSGDTITRYNVVNFDTAYRLNYQLDDFRKLGGKTLSGHVLDLFDTIEATVDWQRLSCPQEGCPWVSMIDRYLHSTTFTYTDVRNFDMLFTIETISQLFVEDNIRASVTVTWSDSSRRRRLSAVGHVYLDSQESALDNQFLLELYSYSHATPDHEIQYVEVENEDTLLFGFLITAGVIVASIVVVVMMRNY